MNDTMNQDETKTVLYDHPIINIDKMVSQLPNNHQHPIIFKVSEGYRKQNKSAYEPELLSIGPYSRRNDVLIHTIEDHKLWYLRSLLQRRRESTPERYVNAIREVVEKARRCYSTAFELETDQFVEMLVIDGIFIVELCRKFSDSSLVDKHDTLFKLNGIHHVLWRDMMLFENQIPFFVVEMLFQMTRTPQESQNINNNTNTNNMVGLLLRYYRSIREYYHFHMDNSSYNCQLNTSDNCPLNTSESKVEVKNVKHILGLIHDLTTGALAEKLSIEREVKWEFIENTIELHEMGIKLRPAKPSSPIFHVEFTKGILEIPLIIIEEKTECFLRNLMAYEQCQDEKSPRIVTDFTTLLLCLIRSSNDVGLLRKYGILNNLIGDDKSALRAISQLSGSVFVSHEGFCYKEIFNNLNKYKKRRRNKWKANLMKNYFNSPWTIISVIAAVVLLFLTFGQTLAAVFPFFAHPHRP